MAKWSSFVQWLSVSAMNVGVGLLQVKQGHLVGVEQECMCVEIVQQ